MQKVGKQTLPLGRSCYKGTLQRGVHIGMREFIVTMFSFMSLSIVIIAALKYLFAYWNILFMSELICWFQV